MTPAFLSLAIAAITVGALHSLAPDHWIPIATVSRARAWTTQRTARVALLCGFGHVTVSAALGIGGAAFGTALFEQFGQKLEFVAGLLLIGFGLTYAVWGFRHRAVKHVHGHRHRRYDHVHEPSRLTTGSLFVLCALDPCVAVIPIVVACASLGWAATLLVIVLYEAATMGTIVALVLLARAGISIVPTRWLARYGNGAAGTIIAAVGALFVIG